jgi:hypothetical protein
MRTRHTVSGSPTGCTRSSCIVLGASSMQVTRGGSFSSSLIGGRTYRMNRWFGCPLGMVVVTPRWSHQGPTPPRDQRELQLSSPAPSRCPPRSPNGRASACLIPIGRLDFAVPLPFVALIASVATWGVDGVAALYEFLGGAAEVIADGFSGGEVLLESRVLFVYRFRCRPWDLCQERGHRHFCFGYAELHFEVVAGHPGEL